MAIIASFLRWFSTCSASRSAKVSDRRAKNASCAARNRVHSASSMSRPARGAAFHSVIRSRIAAAVSRQLGGPGQFLGALDQLLLGNLRRAALGVELGEVLAAPLAERVTSRGELLPQGVVGLAIDALDLLPLLDDGAQPVAGHLPGRRALGDLVSLRDQRLLRSDRVGASLLTGCLRFAGARVGSSEHGVEAGVERAEVADDGCGRQLLLHRQGVGLGRGRITAARFEPLLEQDDLGCQVLVPADVELQPGIGVAGLPRADLTLAVGGLDEDGAVFINASPCRRRAHDWVLNTMEPTLRCADSLLR